MHLVRSKIKLFPPPRSYTAVADGITSSTFLSVRPGPPRFRLPLVVATPEEDLVERGEAVIVCELSRTDVNIEVLKDGEEKEGGCEEGKNEGRGC